MNNFTGQISPGTKLCLGIIAVIWLGVAAAIVCGVWVNDPTEGRRIAYMLGLLSLLPLGFATFIIWFMKSFTKAGRQKQFATMRILGYVVAIAAVLQLVLATIKYLN